MTIDQEDRVLPQENGTESLLTRERFAGQQCFCIRPELTPIFWIQRRFAVDTVVTARFSVIALAHVHRVLGPTISATCATCSGYNSPTHPTDATARRAASSAQQARWLHCRMQ